MNRKQCPSFAVRLVGLFMVIFALGASASAEWKEKVLYSFQGGTDGSTPAGGVVFDKAGNLYGATTDGGANNCPGIAQCGTVFQLEPPVKKGDPWTENQLYIFKGKNSNDGETPAGGMIFDQVGHLYGTTAHGGSGGCVLLGTTVGCGTVFQMTPPQTKGGAWTETVLYSFQGGKDGYVPQGNLTFDRAGNLYGVTLYGGGYGSCNSPYFQYCGTVFKLSPPKAKGGKWKEKVLYSFKSGTDGANPNGGLVLDRKGAVYGTTYFGGFNCPHNEGDGCGTVFRLQPPSMKSGAWTETVLHRFNPEKSDGELPMAGLAIDPRDNLYGTTDVTVFRMTPPKKGLSSWKETVLHTLNGDAYDPEGSLIFDANGNLYGTTYVGSGESLQGSVFRLKPPSKKVGPWTFDVIHGFLGPPDGDFPAANLVFNVNSDFYSTTQAGGTGTKCSGGCGTIFEVEP